MTMPNLFDDQTKQRLIDLYAGPKPTREEWIAQVEKWRKECGIGRTPEETTADQAKRIKCMKYR